MARWHCKRIGINGRGNALRSGKSGNRVTVLACSEAPISPDSPEASTSSSEASSAPATASRTAVGQHSQMHRKPVRCSCLRHKLHAIAIATVQVTCRSPTFNAPQPLRPADRQRPSSESGCYKTAVYFLRRHRVEIESLATVNHCQHSCLLCVIPASKSHSASFLACISRERVVRWIGSK